MKTELRPLVETKPYDNNPRVNDPAVDAVAESIRRFGFRQPLVVDGNGVIVCTPRCWDPSPPTRWPTDPDGSNHAC